MLAVENKHSFADIIESIKCITPAPGRMQAYSKAGCANAVVDFAHTPDALKNVLATLKKQTSGKLAVVFGCGGNRDADKRSKMASIAQELADNIVFTADNPRLESLKTIIGDMQAGLVDCESSFDCTPVRIELDRTEAIKTALSKLESNDLLLVAGKGHEAYQDIGGIKIPYSDEGVLLALGYHDISANKASVQNKTHSKKEAL
jgi:UDP-N-acetylmuramoyl-L-alanyl-D-glutamate--2,6-diaminopimelate ligase